MYATENILLNMWLDASIHKFYRGVYLVFEHQAFVIGKMSGWGKILFYLLF